MDEKVRRILESNIDTFLKHPKETEKSIREYLIKQGVEPNLETILAYLTGMMFGLIEGYYRTQFARAHNLFTGDSGFQVLRRVNCHYLSLIARASRGTSNSIRSKKS